MKLSLILLLILSVACVEEFPTEKNVMILTNKTFDQAIEKYEHILVLFYAPWCGHCKKLHPEYEKAAETLNKEKLFLAKIDATENREIASKFKVQGYPTLYFFKKGQAIEYNGGRKEKQIIEWVRKKSGPATKEVKTKEEIDKLTEKEDVVAIYFGEDKKLMDIFALTAMKNDDFPFITVADEKIMKEFKAEKDMVVLLKKFDEKRNEIKGFTQEKLDEFVEKYSVPKIMKFDNKSAEIIFGKRIPGVFLFSNDKAKFPEYEKMLQEVYEKYSSKVKLVLTNIDSGEPKRLADYLGIKDKDLPTVRMMDTRRREKKYKMEGEITKDNILKWLKDWEDNKLEVHVKSQEIPKDNTGDVFVLVAKNFKKEVLDNDKDVMVLFYAPWCGHCKAFHPTYEEIAKKLKKNSKLLLAKLDATENEIESVRIRGYPTIKFYPGNKKKSSPMDFDGTRDLASVVDFIMKNSYNKLEIDEELMKKVEEGRKKKEEEEKKKKEEKEKKEKEEKEKKEKEEKEKKDGKKEEKKDGKKSEDL